MSGGTKRARRKRNKTKRRVQEQADETVQKAWEQAKGKLPAHEKLLAHFHNYAHRESGTPPPFTRQVEFAHAIAKRAPKLLGGSPLLPWGPTLYRVVSVPWLRPLEDWKPKGKGTHAQFRSLVNHLMVKFSMPPFLLQAFSLDSSRFADQMVQFFVHVAQGGSPYKAFKTGMVPIPLTKRMAHQFMQSPAGSPILHAFRRVQVEAFGGDRHLLKRIQATRLGRDALERDEAFWMAVIQWFCLHPMIDGAQIGPLVDYIAYRKAMANAENVPFLVTGRSPLALLRGMEAWHNELAQTRVVSGRPFPPSGYKPGHWHDNPILEGPASGCWWMTEILGSKELANEGRVLKHCVYSYAHSIEQGHTSIWSLRRDSKPVITVEVDLRKGRIVQVRGKHNREPQGAERAYIFRWARENELRI